MKFDRWNLSTYLLSSLICIMSGILLLILAADEMTEGVLAVQLHKNFSNIGKRPFVSFIMTLPVYAKLIGGLVILFTGIYLLRLIVIFIREDHMIEDLTETHKSFREENEMAEKDRN